MARNRRGYEATGVSGGRPASTATTFSDREIGHRRPRFGRAAAQVRHEQHVLERQQIGMHRRLVLVDVERRAGEQVLLQRPRQRLLVDDRAARRVDEIRRALHARQRALVDQMPRLRRQRHVQRDDVRRDQQAIERHRLGAGERRSRAATCRRRACRTPARAPRPRGRSGRRRRGPSCLPRSSVPSMKSNAQPFHSPRRTSRSPSDSRRVIARISAQVKSATDSVSTSGVLVTTMPRDRA